MQWWDNLRNYFYENSIAQALNGSKTQRQLTNLADAKSIGIVYNSTNPDNDIIITKFAEELRKQNKTVEIIGYVNDAKIDHKADIMVFNKSNVTWAQVPNDERIKNFSSRPFDLLFAAFTEENKTLEYVARTSKAKWRVGVFNERKTDYYELMIMMDAKTDLSYFLQQATNFLNKIIYDSK